MNRSGIIREPFRTSRAPTDQGAGNEGAREGIRELSSGRFCHDERKSTREAGAS